MQVSSYTRSLAISRLYRHLKSVESGMSLRSQPQAVAGAPTDLIKSAGFSFKALLVEAVPDAINASVPRSAIRQQVAQGKLLAEAKGMILSAGQSKKLDLKALMADFQPTSSWNDGGWMYAYYKMDIVDPQFLLMAQQTNVAFTFLGGLEMHPSKYVVAQIQKHWSRPPSNRTGNGNILDWFMYDNHMKNTRGLFEYIRNHPGMPHWKRKFASVDDVIEAVRTGRTLPMQWADDGMAFVEKFVARLRQKEQHAHTLPLTTSSARGRGRGAGGSRPTNKR